MLVTLNSLYLTINGGSDGRASAYTVGDPGWEDLLEKAMATHSSILAWKFPWMEEPTVQVGYSPWGHKESDTTERLHFSLYRCRRPNDGRGVGGCVVHLSPWIHQEYTFGHRNARRTPSESGQGYLTSRKEYIELRRTQ